MTSIREGVGLRVGIVSGEAEQVEWDKYASLSPVGHLHQLLWWAEPLAKYGVSAVFGASVHQ